MPTGWDIIPLKIALEFCMSKRNLPIEDTNTKLPFVSVIVPVYNEVAFIEQTLNSIIAQDYNPFEMEILVLDGGSTDGTIDLIKRIALRDSRIHHLHNSEGTVPYALNIGIKQANGDVIMRMDCHSDYPPHYISRLTQSLYELNADNVGGVCLSVPPDKTSRSEAIAVALSSRFGVGNSDFRIGSSTVKQVDTVPFGCYPRAVFDRIGQFDTDLTRNQDDEFNARLTKQGGRIFLVPDVQIRYYTRDSLSKLARMFFQYGLFKPLANIKSGTLSSYRQLVPCLMILVWIGSAMAALFSSISLIVFISSLLLYVCGICVASAIQIIPTHRWRSRAWLLVVYPLLHIPYGSGYCLGLVYLLIKHRTIKKPSLSR
ncbi:MAG: glycosyltransferase involved in cell wall biosynthesis [Candidatus Azotimanducaceae bacterium]|jgi:glycosyltransferase involved in cell wall biosynthesis